MTQQPHSSSINPRQNESSSMEEEIKELNLSMQKQISIVENEDSFRVINKSHGRNTNTKQRAQAVNPISLNQPELTHLRGPRPRVNKFEGRNQNKSQHWKQTRNNGNSNSRAVEATIMGDVPQPTIAICEHKCLQCGTRTMPKVVIYNPSNAPVVIPLKFLSLEEQDKDKQVEIPSESVHDSSPKLHKTALLVESVVLKQIAFISKEAGITLSLANFIQDVEYLQVVPQTLNRIPTKNEMLESRSHASSGTPFSRPLVINRFPMVEDGTNKVRLGVCIRTTQPVVCDDGKGLPTPITYYACTKLDGEFFYIGFNTQANPEHYEAAYLIMSNFLLAGTLKSGLFITILSQYGFRQHSWCAAATITLLGHTLRYPITGMFVSGEPFMPDLIVTKASALASTTLGLFVTAMELDVTQQAKQYINNNQFSELALFHNEKQVITPIFVSSITSLILQTFLDYPAQVNAPISEIRETSKVKIDKDSKEIIKESVKVPAHLVYGNAVKEKVKNPEESERDTDHIPYTYNSKPGVVSLHKLYEDFENVGWKKSQWYDNFSNAMDKYERSNDEKQKWRLAQAMANSWAQEFTPGAIPRAKGVQSQPNPKYEGKTKTQKTAIKKKESKVRKEQNQPKTVRVNRNAVLSEPISMSKNEVPITDAEIQELGLDM